MKNKKILIAKVTILCVLMLISVFNLSIASQSTSDNVSDQIQLSNMRSMVEQWDWRNVEGNDWTTPIRDQIQDECGSCWAFGAVGSLESAYKVWMNNPDGDFDFSEQYILSCSSGSCDGWYLSRTLRWIQQNGIILENCMPYEANDSVPCESKCIEWREQLFGIKDYVKLSRGNISAIKEALVTYGPLPATMDVYSDFFPEWNGDVYRQNSEELVFGHVIAIVGYDDTWGTSEEGYWICKNSWGANWGEDGWYRIAYGECKIDNNVYYLDGPNYPPNKPNQPEGPSTGEPDIIYTFSTSCNDIDGDELYVLFDWGDGFDSGWMGPYGQDENIIVNYSWESKGSYLVKVKARDSLGTGINDYGLESEWSDPLSVSMPKYRGNPFFWLFERLIERFSFLEPFIIN